METGSAIPISDLRVSCEMAIYNKEVVWECLVSGFGGRFGLVPESLSRDKTADDLGACRWSTRE